MQYSKAEPHHDANRLRDTCASDESVGVGIGWYSQVADLGRCYLSSSEDDSPIVRCLKPVALEVSSGFLVRRSVYSAGMSRIEMGHWYLEWFL